MTSKPNSKEPYRAVFVKGSISFIKSVIYSGLLGLGLVLKHNHLPASNLSIILGLSLLMSQMTLVVFFIGKLSYITVALSVIFVLTALIILDQFNEIGWIISASTLIGNVLYFFLVQKKRNPDSADLHLKSACIVNKQLQNLSS